MKAYSIGLYEKAMPNTLTWKEKLEAAKEAGYDFVEISIDETDAKLARLDWTKEERLELVKTMYEVGLPIRSMCLSGHRKYPLGSSDPAVEARSLEIMEKAIQLSDDLGIRVIQLAGYDVYYEEGSEQTRKDFAENLKKAVEMAAVHGVVLGFETMETAGEGGPYGIALLAAFMDEHELPLEEFLRQRVFVHAKITTAQPDPAEVEGFARYLAAYDKGLDVERTAVEKI